MDDAKKTLINFDSILTKIDEVFATFSYKIMTEDFIEETGNCFPMAVFVGKAAASLGLDARVVHGKPTLMVEPFCVYDHAWVEVSFPFPTGGFPAEVQVTFCLDMSNGNRVCMPSGIYRMLGKIDDSQSVKYEVEGLVDLMLEKGHYGPY
jgi:hypothetical protein